MTRHWGIPPRQGTTYPPGCDWAKPPGCHCQTIARAMGCENRCDDSLWEPKPGRFPWAALAGVAAIILLSWVLARAAKAAEPVPTTCDEVIARVGRKPLWLAERIARAKGVPEDRIAWGRSCVVNNRKPPVNDPPPVWKCNGPPNTRAAGCQ